MLYLTLKVVQKLNCANKSLWLSAAEIAVAHEPIEKYGLDTPVNWGYLIKGKPRPNKLRAGQQKRKTNKGMSPSIWHSRVMNFSQGSHSFWKTIEIHVCLKNMKKIEWKLWSVIYRKIIKFESDVKLTRYMGTTCTSKYIYNVLEVRVALRGARRIYISPGAPFTYMG